MDQLTIYLLVCVHTSKALINHLGGMGAHGEGWRASVGVEDALQSSLRDTERSSEAEGLTEGWSEGRWEWLNTKHRAGKGMAGMGPGSGGLNAET